MSKPANQGNISAIVTSIRNRLTGRVDASDPSYSVDGLNHIARLKFMAHTPMLIIDDVLSQLPCDGSQNVTREAHSQTYHPCP